MKQLVVIGNGVAGIGCLERILECRHGFEITVFGEESHVNYNPALLASVLAGERTFAEIVLNDIGWYQAHGLSVRFGVRVTDIDLEEGTVLSAEDTATPFDKLILATGSSHAMPAIEGVGLRNVLPFRSRDDAQALLGKVRPGRKAVVIGGGAVACEVARGLQLGGCVVTLVHEAPLLMDHQLEPAAAACLARRLQGFGVCLRLSSLPRALAGQGRVERVILASGEELDAEIVVVAGALHPNAELGRRAGLEVRRGIAVNDYMQTSHRDVYAVGGCAEHRGRVFLSSPPFLEQGRVVAAAITGRPGPVFHGAIEEGRVRLRGLETFSAGTPGDPVPDAEALVYEDPVHNIYRKLLVKDRRLCGATLVGDVSGSGLYLEWMREGTPLSGSSDELLFPLGGPVGAVR